MQYFRYDPDANRYAGIVFENDDESDQVLDIRWHSGRLLDTWMPPTAHGFTDNPPREGDFPSLTNYNEIPVMSEKAWKVLSPLIGHCCEALPFHYPGTGIYFIIHVMLTLDCLDQERSVVTRSKYDGRINDICSYAFHEERIAGESIFKLPLECGGGLLVSDLFRQEVEKHKLKGLLFKPLPMVE